MTDAIIPTIRDLAPGEKVSLHAVLMNEQDLYVTFAFTTTQYLPSDEAGDSRKVYVNPQLPGYGYIEKYYQDIHWPNEMVYHDLGWKKYFQLVKIQDGKIIEFEVPKGKFGDRVIEQTLQEA